MERGRNRERERELLERGIEDSAHSLLFFFEPSSHPDTLFLPQFLSLSLCSFFFFFRLINGKEPREEVCKREREREIQRQREREESRSNRVNHGFSLVLSFSSFSLEPLKPVCLVHVWRYPETRKRRK